MSDGLGSNRPVYLVVLALFFAFAGLVLYNNQQPGGPFYGAPDHENREAPMVLRIPTPLADPAPDRKEWREEADVQAQRNMAQWAFWMLILSGAGVVVTGLGVWLVGRTLASTESGLAIMRDTLVEAQKATAAANLTVSETKRIGEAQTRAYVAIETGTVRLASFLSVDVEHHNSGNSPAYDVSLSNCYVTFIETGSNVRSTAVTWASPHGLLFAAHGVLGANSKRKEAIQIEAPKAAHDMLRDCPNGNQIDVTLGGELVWKDIFDRYSTHTVYARGAIQVAGTGFITVSGIFSSVLSSHRERIEKYRSHQAD